MQHEAAQRGEDVSYQRVETAPWQQQQSSSIGVTQTIFGANVAVFLGMVLSIGESMLSGPPGQALVGWGANFGPLTVSGQWWRLLTCVFVHGSLIHIAANMYGLWILGRTAEALYGHWTFGSIYLISGVSGSIASVVWNPGVLSVGASGAIFGVAAALLASFYLGEFSMPRVVVMNTVRSLAIVLGINLFFGSVAAHIDNAAHIGGLVMGLILGALIAKAAPMSDDLPRRIAVLLVGAIIALGTLFWLHYSRSYFVHAQNGVGLLNQGKPDEAIAELKKAVKQHPDFLAGHAGLAQAYLDKHDYDSAAREIESIIALRPHDEGAYYQLGYIYMKQKNPVKAQEVFERLLKIAPDSADGHFGLGEAFSEQHRDMEALAEYERVRAIDPGHEAINYNLGVEQWRIKRYDDAIASLLKQRDESDDVDNERLLADVYTRKGMLNEAEDARERAARIEHP